MSQHLSWIEYGEVRGALDELLSAFDDTAGTANYARALLDQLDTRLMARERRDATPDEERSMTNGPRPKDEALRAIAQVRAMLDGAELLDGLRRHQAKGTLDYAAEQVGLIQEIKRARRQPAGVPTEMTPTVPPTVPADDDVPF